jgi:hypothetical protein
MIRANGCDLPNVHSFFILPAKNVFTQNLNCFVRLFLTQHFMELEPVAELEEDSGAGEDSPTSSISPSLSPQPYTADMWAEVS